MKLFKNTEWLESELTYVQGLNKNGKEVTFCSQAIRQKEAELISETVEYLLNEKESGSTIRRIRYLIVNLFNCNTYPDLELFIMIRNADSEHNELITDIIDHCNPKYGNAIFLLINTLAPQIIEKFYNEKE
jgi:hypothetical protein